MNIYFKSRYLSDRLDINLAKWKRWSRDFLTPDPLGGLQSGVARQFNLKDAFKVYFGGYLVSDLKLTIPDALCVLNDLSPWLKKNGYFKLEATITPESIQRPQTHMIYLYHEGHQLWSYTIRTLDNSADSTNTGKMTETYKQTLIGTKSDPLANGKVESAHVIAISTVFRNFLNKIG